ncbi:hypothetical protein MJN76_33280, partial [Salmonella enterica subsp. enterica serovar Anatum]|nr:hypothetical protein [Salmonella enterica subsp. enterica serovar Anatum]
DGLKVNDPKVDERLIRQEAGMVFQQFYLFPHLTALENVMFGPVTAAPRLLRGGFQERRTGRFMFIQILLLEDTHADGVTVFAV